MMEWNLLDFNGSYFFILAYLRYLASSNSINIGPGNSFLPDGTKPLPEIMFACREQSAVRITWNQLSARDTSAMNR